MMKNDEWCKDVQEAAEGVVNEADTELELKIPRYVELTTKVEHGSRVKDLITIILSASVGGVETPVRYGAYSTGDTVTVKFWSAPSVLASFLAILIINEVPYILGMNGVEYARYGEF